MKKDRAILADRYWAIPAICGLLVLHHDFKGGRFSNVTRLVWAQSSVEVDVEYGTVSVTGAKTDSLNIIFTIHRDGAVGLRLVAGAPEDRHQNILRFLAGEVSREASRWSVDLVNWVDGALDDNTKSAIFSMVSVAVAYPLVDVNVVANIGLSKARGMRKIRLLSESFTIDITPAGKYGVNVYQAGCGLHDGVRNRYLEPDMRSDQGMAKKICPRLLHRARNAGLHSLQLMLLPLAALGYLFEKKQMDELRVAGALVDYLPNLPIDVRSDGGMSALSN